MTLDSLLLISFPFFHSRFGVANTVQRPPCDKWILEYIVLECIGNALNDITWDTRWQVCLDVLFSMTPSPSSTLPACTETGVRRVGAGGEGRGREGKEGCRQTEASGTGKREHETPLSPFPSILPVLFSFDSNKDLTFLYSWLRFPYVIIRLIFFSGLLVLCRTSTNSPRLTVAQKDPPWIPRKNALCGNKLLNHLALVLRRSFSTEKEIFLFVM